MCVSITKAWQLAHQPEIAAAQARAAAEQPPRPPAAYLDPGLVMSMPPQYDAITMATIPQHGPALVCYLHCPDVPDASTPARRPFLIAQAGMNGLVR